MRSGEEEDRSFTKGLRVTGRTLAVTLGVMETLEKLRVSHVVYQFSCSLNYVLGSKERPPPKFENKALQPCRALRRCSVLLTTH